MFCPYSFGLVHWKDYSKLKSKKTEGGRKQLTSRRWRMGCGVTSHSFYRYVAVLLVLWLVTCILHTTSSTITTVYLHLIDATLFAFTPKWHHWQRKWVGWNVKEMMTNVQLTVAVCNTTTIYLFCLFSRLYPFQCTKLTTSLHFQIATYKTSEFFFAITGMRMGWQRHSPSYGSLILHKVGKRWPSLIIALIGSIQFVCFVVVFYSFFSAYCYTTQRASR